MSEDPSGFTDGPNLYQYALNNPIMFVDYSGNQAMGTMGMPMVVPPILPPPMLPPANLGDGLTRDIGMIPTTYLNNSVSMASKERYSGTSFSNKNNNNSKNSGIRGWFKKVSDFFFARKTGKLNKSDWLRVGWGWKGTRKSGKEVFRIGIGKKGSRTHTHIDFFGI